MNKLLNQSHKVIVNGKVERFKTKDLLDKNIRYYGGGVFMEEYRPNVIRGGADEGTGKSNNLAILTHYLTEPMTLKVFSLVFNILKKMGGFLNTLESVTQYEKVFGEILKLNDMGKVMMSIMKSLRIILNPEPLEGLKKVTLNLAKASDEFSKMDFITRATKVLYNGENINKVEQNADEILYSIYVLKPNSGESIDIRARIYGMFICDFRETAKELFSAFISYPILFMSDDKIKENLKDKGVNPDDINKVLSIVNNPAVVEKYFNNFSEIGYNVIKNLLEWSMLTPFRKLLLNKEGFTFGFFEIYLVILKRALFGSESPQDYIKKIDSKILTEGAKEAVKGGTLEDEEDLKEIDEIIKNVVEEDETDIVGGGLLDLFKNEKVKKIIDDAKKFVTQDITKLYGPLTKIIKIYIEAVGKNLKRIKSFYMGIAVIIARVLHIEKGIKYAIAKALINIDAMKENIAYLLQEHVTLFIVVSRMMTKLYGITDNTEKIDDFCIAHSNFKKNETEATEKNLNAIFKNFIMGNKKGPVPPLKSEKTIEDGKKRKEGELNYKDSQKTMTMGGGKKRITKKRTPKKKKKKTNKNSK